MTHAYQGLVDYIALQYRWVAEIGIGHWADVASALTQRDVSVIATDTKSCPHDGLKVIVDDVTKPDLSLYTGVELLYSLRPPPELVPYMSLLAEAISADLIVKPLASEYVGGQLTRYGGSTFFMWKFS